jgi:ABC-type dipeptide/oligopeptide/nickel transport system permease component
LLTYILRRLFYLLPVCIGILLVTFLIKAAIPTDAVSMLYSGQLTEEDSAEASAAIRAEFHLDQPPLVQFYYYVSDILHGDLGVSVRTQEPVIDLIGVILGVGTGIISAYYKDTFFDVTAMTISLFGLSMPAFFLGILLILIFCVELRWLPVIGEGGWKHLLLPSLNLGLILSASLARITRSSMLEVLDQDYIRTARAKGLGENLVVFKHALKNALLPVVTIIGLQIGGLLGGAFIIENVFAWHGIGELAVKAIIWRDFSITQGIILISAGTYVFANLVVDILYQVIDPRVKLTS